MTSARAHLRVLRTPPGEEAPIGPLDLEAVFRRFGPYVMRIASRILGDRSDAEDTLQEVFLEAHRGVHRLREPAAIRSFLATITVRRARRRLRRRALLAWVGLERPIDPDTVIDARASADARARLAAVYRVLDRVSADARAAWVLRCVEDEPLEHIAVVLGCSRATAHRRIQEAQAALDEAFDA